MACASARLSGRRTMVRASPPTSLTSAATASSSSLLPETSRSLPPSAPSAMAQPRPKAPDAPVTIATLPLTSNSESGLRSCGEISLIGRSRIALTTCDALHPGFDRQELRREHGLVVGNFLEQSHVEERLLEHRQRLR